MLVQDNQLARHDNVVIAAHFASAQGKRDGSTHDEDFAWESKEFLRKLCIGKVTPSLPLAHALASIDGASLHSAHIGLGYSRLSFVLQTCTFRVDYTLENIPGREFGSVFVGPSSENVALKVVSEGWAKVKPLRR